MRRDVLFFVLLILLGSVCMPAIAFGESPSDEPEELEIVDDDLAPRFVRWLAEVEFLLTEEERDYFQGLEEDFRRTAFIEAFWKERDPYDDTTMNEFRVHYEERVDSALASWESMTDARSQTWIYHGEPYRRMFHKSKEIEIWIYDEAPEDEKFSSYDTLYPVLLYRPMFADQYKRWLPYTAEAKTNESISRAINFIPANRKRLPRAPLIDFCEDAHVGSAMKRIAARAQDRNNADPITVSTLEVPEPSKEWVASFHSQSAVLPEDADLFAAELGFNFPGRHQQRTVAQALLEVRAEDLGVFQNEVNSFESVHQLLIFGEVVRDGELFERFRYRYEVPADGQDVGLIFQRYFRPGEVRVLLKVEDLFGRRFAYFDQTLDVPTFDAEPSGDPLAELREESELYRALREADEATARGERTLQLLPPPGVVVTGMVRLRAIAAGNFDRVVFSLDGEPIFTKREPPYTVEFDMGDVPTLHRVRVDGYEDDARLAGDEILLNPGGQRFRVVLTEPQKAGKYERSLRAAVQVAVPDGKELDRIELFLDEERIATLYQAPFVQPVLLPNANLAYVRAVGYLKDGNTSEDLVFINAPGEIDEVDVQFVELYAAVYDRGGRFIPGLKEENFRVLEDGVPQRARRFEWVENLPLHVGLAIDVSASMEDSLEEVTDAAQTFVEEVVRPHDRATLIAFNHEPDVRVGFTNEVEVLNRELAALRTGGGTALYDSLAFALHYFHGIKGQKALLLLADGVDESSGFEFDDALEFARRAGVQIYVIGLKEALTEKGGRRVLKQLARETGGRSFWVEDLSGIREIYAEIQQELRSQYLFAYQSTSDKDASEFRRVEVTVTADGRKADVRTLIGYYP